MFPTFYLAHDRLTALFEVEALLGSPYATWLAAPSGDRKILNVSVALQSVVDLTLAGPQATLGTTAQELTGDWRAYRLRSAITPVNQPAGVAAPTQELGEALYSVPGLEAFVAVSAKIPTHKTLIVFPDKLTSGSELVCHDEKGKILAKIAPKGSRKSVKRARRSR